MEILMNGEKLDFSLEKEKRLGEVVQNFEGWAVQTGHFIDKVMVDGKELTLEEAGMSLMDLSSISRIDFSMKGKVEQIEEVISMAHHYIQQFIQEAEKGKEPFCLNKREKIEGLTWIIDSISLIAQNLGISPAYIFSGQRNLEELLNFFKISASQLSRFVHDSNFFFNYIQEGILPRLPLLRTLLSGLVRYYNYLLNPENGAEFRQDFLAEVQEMKKALEEIPSALQDGRDQDAVSMIQKIFSFFQSFFVLLSKSSLDAEPSRRVTLLKEELTTLLEQVHQNFQDRDIVSVSDIMEYEIGEKLQELADLFASAKA